MFNLTDNSRLIITDKAPLKFQIFYFTSFLIILFLFLSYALKAQEGVPRIYADQNINTTVRNKIFEQALIKSYYENPRIYEAHREALKGRDEADRISSSISLDRSSRNVYRMLPDPLGTIRESGLIDWEERKEDYDIEKREEMAQDPDEVARVASKMRLEMYNSSNSKSYLKNLYNLTHKLEGENKLPNPVDIDGLRQQYPDISKDLEINGFTDDQVSRFCAGKMDKKNLKIF